MINLDPDARTMLAVNEIALKMALDHLPFLLNDSPSLPSARCALTIAAQFRDFLLSMPTDK